ncbi:hypothetical protein [Nannocystis punicea]|uniref:Uncharacterized protein n=1 Tax=Nannocystis punicea TaxID=2995304 RepID=A0ABY7H9T4_9BACT|nr:hypothetical protein [Nannocystis poenicansa]WAS95860.1 hypothetical protein O0S08_06825 [Nannocystis poenicansa]
MLKRKNAHYWDKSGLIWVFMTSPILISVLAVSDVSFAQATGFKIRSANAMNGGADPETFDDEARAEDELPARSTTRWCYSHADFAVAWNLCEVAGYNGALQGLWTNWVCDNRAALFGCLPVPGQHTFALVTDP